MRPNTATRRTSARSSGASVSICVIVAASADSGRSVTPPDSIAERNKSRRNCGLPPGSVRDDFEGVHRERALLGCQLRQPQRIPRRERLRARRGPPRAPRAPRIRCSRTAAPTANSHDRAARPPVRCASSSAEASSMWCTSSISTSRLVGHHDLEESAVTVSCSFARRLPSASNSTSGVTAISTSNTDREQRQPRREVGCPDCHLARGFARRCGRRASSRPNSEHLAEQLAPHDIRDRRGVGFAGGVQLWNPAAASRSASSSRVLPIPASPMISIRRPTPTRAGKRLADHTEFGIASGQTAAACSVTCRVRELSAGPTDHAWTGWALPFTVNGRASVVANSVLERFSTSAVA